MRVEVIKDSMGRKPKQNESTAKNGRTQDRHGKYNMLRLDPDLFVRLKAVADFHDRTATKELKRAVIAHLEIEEKKAGITPPKPE